jgi:two-component system response regulator AtoC
VAQDGDEVLACLRANQVPISAVVLDVMMPRRTGIEALKEIRRFNREIPVIMISGSVSALNVVEAMKMGANDYIPKPIKPEDLRKALKAVFDNGSTIVAEPVEPAQAATNKNNLFGGSPVMRDLQSMIGQIAWSEAPVLIQGETGTGKEVLARELHARSPRAKKSFLKLNCVALPSELVESELFGYERGAFTGAFEKKLGMFALADGGTILLDEIGDMDFKLQAKLLQVLQDQEFQRLGGKDTIKVDVRVIAATHRDLEKAIADGNFREDLYYRLNVINLQVPPLRERLEDIAPLAEFLMRKHTTSGVLALQIPPSLKDLFQRYRWPGNVRELENIVRKFLVLRDSRLIELDLLQKIQRTSGNGHSTHAPAMAAAAAAGAPALPLAQLDGDPAAAAPGVGPVLEQVAKAKQEAERSAIIGALKSTNWNRKQAALLLQIDYKAMLYKMNRLSIKKEKASPRSIPARPETPSVAAAPQPASPHPPERAFVRALG